MWTRGRLSLALLIMVLSALPLLSACDNAPSTDKQAAAPAAPVDVLPVGISFESASKPKSSKQVALLNYVFNKPLSEPVRVSLSDPKNPPKGLLDLGFAALRITPQMLAPKILPNRLDECWVQGCYMLCLRAADGLHMADFEINAWGALILIEGSVQEGLEYERVDAEGRTLYVFYDQAPGGGYASPRVAVEYLRDEKFNKQQFKGNDAWLYHFEYPDGELRFHSGDGLEAMRDELAATGKVETEEWVAYTKERHQQREQRRSCSAGG